MSHSLHDIAYWKYHDSSLPTCIFNHRFTGSHEGFQYIIPELKKFHILVRDLPGFGETKLGIDSFTIDELAKRVNDFVRDLELSEPPFVMGHSMGGLVVASMLSQSPELFNKKAILVSPVATKVNYLDSRKIGAFLGRLQFYLGKTVPGVGPKISKKSFNQSHIYRCHFDRQSAQNSKNRYASTLQKPWLYLEHRFLLPTP